MRNYLIVPLIFFSFLLSACGSAVPKMKPFKMDIQQGNVVTSKMLLQLRPGMTKSQVKFIMGTPLIIDSFHSNRWDYFYQMRQSGKVTEQRRVILDFEKELLARVRGDVVPQGTPGAEPAQDANTLASAKSVTPPPKKDDSVLDKLKFWKSDEKAPAKEAANADATKPKAEKSLMDKLKFWKNDETPAAKEALKSESVPVAAQSVAADSPAEGAPSLLAVPIVGVSSVDAPIAEAPVQEMSDTEKSIVAMPAAAEPVAEPVKPEPTVSEPAVSEPTVAEPEVPVVAAPVAAPEPTAKLVETPTPEAPVVVKDEPFIFRMDKTLNLKNLEKLPANNLDTKASPKKTETAPLEPTEEPGYFERMLEKIGF
jgi:outer membrane protein assembly factor BamE